MKKCLITGVGGFVGRHLLRYFDEVEAGVTEVLGIDLHPETATFTPQRFSYHFEQADLTQPERFMVFAKEFEPDWFIHLAAESSVAASWRDPDRCIMDNGNIISNVLRFLKLRPMKHRSECRMLAVGSSEVYGYREGVKLLEESQPRQPCNPYAISRLYQEDRIRLDVQWQRLNIVSTRSFNHTGPGQSDRFVVPSFIRQLCDAKQSGRKSVRLKTGNIQLIRDFSDVRDVVRAYHLLLEHGKNGETYNVCSGKGISLSKIIEILGEILDLEVMVEVDRGLVRSKEPPIMVGSTEKMFRATGWTPRISLEQTLRDMVNSG
ncbi:MAG: GDP-mannose 4,6-dehydratase [Planctomycetaceae bacterium]|jgi:GDP-4-dehydro-6-deoxy-D-mannose reductase|nr:GDP-mannose 4,6-dehydratase [Planctomycetaceae bacterium]